jgi:hypothetical protein
MYIQDDSQSPLTQQKSPTAPIDDEQYINQGIKDSEAPLPLDDFEDPDEWFENQAGEAIADLLGQKERSVQRLRVIEVEISEIEGQILSVKTTIDLLRKRNGIEPMAERQGVDTALNTMYAGKGLREALIIFAQNNNGIVNESGAIQTLMNAGFYPTYKKAKASINTTLNRESNPEQEKPTFKKLNKGLYQLLPY